MKILNLIGGGKKALSFLIMKNMGIFLITGLILSLRVRWLFNSAAAYPIDPPTETEIRYITYAIWALALWPLFLHVITFHALVRSGNGGLVHVIVKLLMVGLAVWLFWSSYTYWQFVWANAIHPPIMGQP